MKANMNLDYLNKIKSEGIVVIPNYLSLPICEKIINEINSFKKKERIIREKDEGIGGDLRIFNFEDYSLTAQEFARNSFIQNLVSKYLGTQLEAKSVLAGKVVFNKSLKTNSGGDWHRDSDLSQMKAMIYLTDVSEDNGPFTFISLFLNLFIIGEIISLSSLNFKTLSQCGFKPTTPIFGLILITFL